MLAGALNWPFPPPGGPVPWTKKQVKDYERKERDKIPPAPFSSKEMT